MDIGVCLTRSFFFPIIPTQDYTVGSLMQILIPSLLYFKALLGRRNDKPKDRYSRLDKEIENSNQSFITDQQQQQEVTIHSQLGWRSASLGIV